jgi:hypothetical protein
MCMSPRSRNQQGTHTSRVIAGYDDGPVLRLAVIEGSMSEGGISGSRSGTTFETAPDNRRIPRLGRLHPGTAGRSDPACARHRLRPVGQNGLVRTVPGRSSGRHVQHNADCDSHFLNRGFPVANDRAHRDSIKRRRFHQVGRHSNTNRERTQTVYAQRPQQIQRHAPMQVEGPSLTAIASWLKD